MKLVSLDVFLKFARKKTAHLRVNALHIGRQRKQGYQYQYDDGKDKCHRCVYRECFAVRRLRRPPVALRSVILAGLCRVAAFTEDPVPVAPSVRSISDIGSRNPARRRRSSRAISPESVSWS